jgi:hypothetical protein
MTPSIYTMRRMTGCCSYCRCAGGHHMNGCPNEPEDHEPEESPDELEEPRAVLADGEQAAID